jgi:hypothetical protein
MIKLGSKSFDVVKASTIEWDVTLLQLLQGCGLSDVVMHQGETAEGLAHRVYRTLMSSGAVFEILGCALIEHGTDVYTWTPAMMRETADHIRKLHAPEDKAAITSQIVSLVTSFFVQGLLSLSTSPTFSNPPAADAGETQPLPNELRSAETSTTLTDRGH